MCTIAVTFNEARRNVLAAMAAAAKHRGPDSDQIALSARHGAAACRLSIFGDPSRPMGHVDQMSGRMTFLNGEIYNYRELWSELEAAGIARQTDLETELISRLYERHGVDFAAKLHGMFAIAILEDSRLVLARDRFGIKPMYYARLGNRLVACSEIKGLLKHPDVHPSLDMTALEETRVFGYVSTQGKTFFTGIQQVSPGTVLTFDGERLEQRSFAPLPGAKTAEAWRGPDFTEAVQETRRRVLAAVERLFSHGEQDKGIFLSGGVDSSTMALVAKRLLGKDVPTFTLFDQPATPDRVSARKVADALGTRHEEFEVTARDYWGWLPDYVAHYEGLMAGGVFHIQGGLAFHILAKHISERVRVAFSGEGADELFGGYYWIHTHPLGFSDRIRNNAQAVHGNPELHALINGLFPQPEDEALYRRNLFDFLLKGGLSNYHLQSVDRSAGAFGMEIRPLYLENGLSQWAMELPIEYKVLHKRETKKVLREAFRKEFQEGGIESVLTRDKMGMPSAMETLHEEVMQTVEQTIPTDDLTSHPLGSLLGSKMNLLLYDTFEQIFFKGWDHHASPPPQESYLARIWPSFCS